MTSAWMTQTMYFFTRRTRRWCASRWVACCWRTLFGEGLLLRGTQSWQSYSEWSLLCVVCALLMLFLYCGQRHDWKSFVQTFVVQETFLFFFSYSLLCIRCVFIWARAWEKGSKVIFGRSWDFYFFDFWKEVQFQQKKKTVLKNCQNWLRYGRSKICHCMHKV